jgi:hypothetical protein
MDKQSFKKYMGEIKRFDTESNTLNDHFRAMTDGGFCSVGYWLEGSYCDLLSEAIGDTSEWVAWYCFENDFGAKKHDAGYDGNEKPICNLDDLWRLIQEGINHA